MRVLIACERSGMVRRAFRARGHDAWSCDIVPADDGGEHIHGSVLDHDVVKLGWDALIAFPDCTFLTVSANRWANDPWRMEARHWSLAFVRALWALPIAKKAMENPIGVLPTMWKRPTQIIQPWYFGDDASKATCLWLDGFPKLVETNRLPGDARTRRANQTASGQNKLGPSATRAAERAQTYPGIAQAMAEQWG